MTPEKNKAVFDRDFAETICKMQEDLSKMPEAKIEDCEGQMGPCPLNGPIHGLVFCLRGALTEIDRLKKNKD